MNTILFRVAGFVPKTRAVPWRRGIPVAGSKPLLIGH